MAAAPKIILAPISALKLSSTDVLVLHFEKQPSAEQLEDLRLQMKAQNWTINYMVLVGPFKVSRIETSKLPLE